MYQPDSQSPTPRGSLMDFFITAMAFSIILRGLNLDFVIVEFKLRLVGGGGNNGSDVWSIPDRIAQPPRTIRERRLRRWICWGSFLRWLGFLRLRQILQFRGRLLKIQIDETWLRIEEHPVAVIFQLCFHLRLLGGNLPRVIQ